jgi:uncharacterized membrane protein YkvA (DUF1232 family)
MPQQNDDFYKGLRKKIEDWVKTKEGKESTWLKYILITPDLFHLLCRLSLDKDVPAEHKAKLAICIAYFISPIDLIPEALVGPVGFLDDIAITAYVLNGIINKVNPEIVQKHWAGDGDIFKLVQVIIEKADEMIGAGLWKKIMNMIDKGRKAEK